MKAREFTKRALIYGLGLTLYAYELFAATVEGLGLNPKGFWGEPTRPVEPDAHVAHADPVAQGRLDMFERAGRDFERWEKMTPTERAANIHARNEAWLAREQAAQKALAVWRDEYDRGWRAWYAAVDAWKASDQQGPYPDPPEPLPFPEEAKAIPQNLVVGAPFEKESVS